MNARALQLELERFYELESGPDLRDFVREDDQGREHLLIRDAGDALELALVLPTRDGLLPDETTDLDGFLQVVEGVSHFVYVVERARTGLPTTRLELELQAEVDKFVVLANRSDVLATGEADRHRRGLPDVLYGRVRFLHGAETAAGSRYRLANSLAARFVTRLIDRVRSPDVRRHLREFYRAGQTDKIRLAAA